MPTGMKSRKVTPWVDWLDGLACLRGMGPSPRPANQVKNTDWLPLDLPEALRAVVAVLDGHGYHVASASLCIGPGHRWCLRAMRVRDGGDPTQWLWVSVGNDGIQPAMVWAGTEYDGAAACGQVASRRQYSGWQPVEWLEGAVPLAMQKTRAYDEQLRTWDRCQLRLPVGEFLVQAHQHLRQGTRRASREWDLVAKALLEANGSTAHNSTTYLPALRLLQLAGHSLQSYCLPNRLPIALARLWQACQGLQW